MEQFISVPAQALRRLLAAKSGDAALLYLYLTAGGKLEGAERELGFAENRFDFAAATLRQLGLLPQEEKKHLPSSEAPVYTEADVQREYAAGEDFSSMVGETQRRLGRMLSTEELKILLSIYRYLGLAPEVVSILVNYCIQRAHARGSARMPSIRTIEKEAYRWADNEIDTMEQAAAYVQRQLQLQTQSARIHDALQLGERKFTAGEEKLVRTWLEWGFGEKEVRLAYEKTCMNTGGLRWPYLNSILKSWYEQGLTTLSAIEAGDRQQTRGAKPNQPRKAVGHDDPLTEFQRDAIRRMMQQPIDDGNTEG